MFRGPSYPAPGDTRYNSLFTCIQGYIYFNLFHAVHLPRQRARASLQLTTAPTPRRVLLNRKAGAEGWLPAKLVCVEQPVK